MLQPPQQLPSPQSTDANKNKQRGTGFTNINRILGANQGAGQKIGQALQTNLQGQAGAVKQGIEKGKSQFQAGAQEATQKATSAIQQGKDLQKSANDSSDEAYAERLAKYNADQLAQQGQALQQAAYTGPQGLQNAQQIQSQAATAGALGQLAGTTAGQAQLLRSQVAQRGGYTRGQNALDQLLVGKEGQRAVQQGRSAVTGLPQQALTETQAAEQKAQASTAAIEANKAATMKALQQQLSGSGEEGGPVGFTEQAKKQAEEFNKNATRLQQLMSGVDEEGNPIKELSDADKDLIANSDKYGLENSDIYIKNNENEVQQALGDVAGSLALDPGALRFTGQQQGAAANLAKFLGQKDTAKNIEANKFSEDAFKLDQGGVLGTGQESYKKDLETQARLRKIADWQNKRREELGPARAAGSDIVDRMNQIMATNPMAGSGSGQEAIMREQIKNLTPEQQRWLQGQGFDQQIQNFMQGAGIRDSLAQKQQRHQLGSEMNAEDRNWLLNNYTGSEALLDQYNGLALGEDFENVAKGTVGDMTNVRQQILNRYLKGQA